MLTNERTVTFAEAAEHLPRLNGRKIHTSALWRWARHGVRGVKLEALLLGGRFCTSIEALERFGKALAETAAPKEAPPATPSRTNRRRGKAIGRARKRLEAAGI
jgi:hypothetical protein